MCKYLLDSNVFIEASNAYYAMDIVPSFWKSIINYHAHKKVYSVDWVKKELLEGDDALTTWIESESDFSSTFFLESGDDSVIATHGKIISWVNNKVRDYDNYSDKTINDFTHPDKADPYLIAYAKIHKHTVVTQEKKGLSIPLVCKEFKIECINTFDMMRRLEIQY